MGRKTQIAVIAALAVVALGAVGAYAYDSSQKDKIADGVTIAGVDVGGLEAEEAAAAVRRHLLVPLRHSLKVSFGGETWALPGAKLKVRASVDEAVERALEESQEGGLPTRLVPYATGGQVDKQASAPNPPPQPSVNQLPRKIPRH